MTKSKKCIPIVVLVLLIITVGISKAEPTPTLQYLMDTPVSMLDFGIYRLDNLLIGDVSNLAIPIAIFTFVNYQLASNIQKQDKEYRQ